jgi:DNA-binding transcriptional LysR family regulator
MPQYSPDDRGHYLCFLSRQHLPARMRVFIDFMTESIRAQDLLIIDSLLPKQA